MAQDPTFPLIPILNFIGVLLVLIPFSTSSLQKWNTGVCMLAIYVSVMCLFIAIDTIVWSNNFNVIAPVWCDIGEFMPALSAYLLFKSLLTP